MIARLWHGRVPIEKADVYLKLTREAAIPDYRRVPGNLGAWVLRRDEGAIAHIETLTFWASREAIKAFAGADIDAAKYYDFDGNYLLEFEPTVRHYDVYEH